MVSIIMPVYNAEPTLSAAVESVLNQSSEDWELIIIDDSSSDRSLQIAESFAERHEGIKVYTNPENLGPATARNIGIDNAKGEYVAFIDADDTYEKDFVSTMIDTAKKYEAEIVWCNYIIKSKEEKGCRISNNIPKNVIYSNAEAASFFFIGVPGIGSMCNKVYLKSFLDEYNIRLNPERVRAEDWEFNLLAFSNLKRMILIDAYLYNYIHTNNQSIMATFRMKDYGLIFRSIKLLKEVNARFNLGKSQKEIINTNRYHLLEMVYRGLNSQESRKFQSILKGKKFQETIKFIESKNLPHTYKILRFLLKNKLYFLALTFSRFSNKLISLYS